MLPNFLPRESKLLDERLLVDLPREGVTSALSDQQVVDEDRLHVSLLRYDRHANRIAYLV